MRYRLLPRWNVLPLLLGLTAGLGLALDWFGVPTLLPEQLATPFLHFFITGLIWVLLGIALLDPAPHGSLPPPFEPYAFLSPPPSLGLNLFSLSALAP